MGDKIHRSVITRGDILERNGQRCIVMDVTSDRLIVLSQDITGREYKLEDYGIDLRGQWTYVGKYNSINAVFEALAIKGGFSVLNNG